MATSPLSRQTSEMPTVHYRERLTPSLGIWVSVLGIAATAGVPLIRIGPGWLAILTSSVVTGAVVVAVLMASPLIEVRGQWLRAGGAAIDAKYLGRAVLVDRDQMRLLRGEATNARAFWCQRAWIAAGALIIINDRDDPAPYWLLSSRHPQALIEAINGMQDG
ncbi:MAG: DUF3093 domain-containing protein [Actinomycetota bacterium]